MYREYLLYSKYASEVLQHEYDITTAASRWFGGNIFNDDIQIGKTCKIGRTAVVAKTSYIVLHIVQYSSTRRVLVVQVPYRVRSIWYVLMIYLLVHRIIPDMFL